MSIDNSDQLSKIIKYIGIAAVSVGVNHLIRSFLVKDTRSLVGKNQSFKDIPSIARID